MLTARKDNLLLREMVSCKSHSGLHIFGGQVRVVCNDLIHSHTSRQFPQDLLNGDARPFDYGLAEHYFRIDLNTGMNHRFSLIVSNLQKIIPHR
jgi:hypothetical protein